VWEHWVALHSAVLDSSMSTPRRAPPADPFTAPLSLSPCPLRLHDPCRGREGALHACSHLCLLAGGVWWVGTRVRRHQRGFPVEGGCALLHTHAPCTTTLHSSSHPLSSYKPLSHHPTAASARSSSARWVPPCPALHTRADSTQHQTREGQTSCALGGGGVRQQCWPPTHTSLLPSPTRRFQVYFTLRAAHDRGGAEHTRGTWSRSPS
jgi:hypothetical protein